MGELELKQIKPWGMDTVAAHVYTFAVFALLGSLFAKLEKSYTLRDLDGASSARDVLSRASFAASSDELFTSANQSTTRLLNFLVERVEEARKTGYTPSPVPGNLREPHETGCITGELQTQEVIDGVSIQRLLDFKLFPDSLAPSNDTTWCSDRAGEGRWTDDGRWVWKYAKICGHHWLKESEVCAMLQDFAVFLVGDSTSRRMAAHLKSLLGGLETANRVQPCDDALRGGKCPQTIPDPFRRFTDGKAACIPQMRCPGLAIAGTVMLPPGVTEYDSEMSERLPYWTSFQRPPYVTSIKKHTTVDLDIPLATEYVAFAKKLAKTVKMYYRPKVIYGMNAGGMHLVAQPSFFMPEGAKPNIYHREKSQRQEYLAHFERKRKAKNLISNYRAKYSFFQHEDIATLLAVHLEQAPEYQHPDILYVWRTAYPVNVSNSSKLDQRWDPSAFSSPNEVLRMWNAEASKAAKSKGFITADGYNAQLPGSSATKHFQPSFAQPEFGKQGNFHLRDHGRRLQLQIFLNAIAPHVMKRHALDANL